MLLRVLEPATVFTTVHIDLTGKPQDHRWDVLWPLYFGFPCCHVWLISQTTHRPLNAFPSGPPPTCWALDLHSSGGLTTLESAALFFVSKYYSHAEGAAATPLPHTQKEQSGAETADVLLHHHLESAGILHHCLGCCLHSSWQEKASGGGKVSWKKQLVVLILAKMTLAHLKS